MKFASKWDCIKATFVWALHAPFVLTGYPLVYMGNALLKVTNYLPKAYIDRTDRVEKLRKQMREKNYD